MSSYPTPSSDNAAAPTKFARPIPKSRRRDQPQLSCNLCRRRKLKCDRRRPCETCSQRGLSLSCTYPMSSTRDPPNHPDVQTEDSSTMRGRINQLEQLVASLASKLHGNENFEETSANTYSAATNGLDRANTINEHQSELPSIIGSMSVNDRATSYVEEDHWTAILDGIAELRECFGTNSSTSKDNIDEPAQKTDSGPDLLFGDFNVATKEDILSALPPRPVADRVVAEYFAKMDMVFGLVLHRGTFLKQVSRVRKLAPLLPDLSLTASLLKYERFWNNQNETSLMWIAILYSILCFGAMSQKFFDVGAKISIPSSQSKIEIYRGMVAQCLRVGDYTKGTPYTVEALLFYLIVEYLRSEDTQTSYWLILGLIVRIALKMGYHLDGSHFPQMSVFEAEMRRRIWYLIVQQDTFASAQVGLPRMTGQFHADTVEPRNLVDEDFDDTMTELPPSRPESDNTLAQFLVYKTRLTSVLGMITDLKRSAQRTSLEEALKLDAILNDTFKQKPAGLEEKAMSESHRDRRDIIFQRIYLALTYHMTQIILHKTFLLAAKTNRRFEYSAMTCIGAAIKMLEYQETLDKETQADGLLAGDRWKVLSLIQQNFLLGTTILCFYLHHDLSTEPSLQHDQPDTKAQDTRNRIVKSLSISYEIWRSSSDESREAQRAAECIRVILGKFYALDARKGEVKDATIELNTSADPTPAASQKSPWLQWDNAGSRGTFEEIQDDWMAWSRIDFEDIIAMPFEDMDYSNFESPVFKV